MKITIAYLPGEEQEADFIKRAVKCIFSVVKINESARHLPFKHIYITTKKPEK